MRVDQNAVVTFDYTVTDTDGQVLDTSKGQGPLAYIHGKGQIVTGLEKAMVGKEPGASFQVSVTAAEGYGERDDRRMVTVPRSELPPDVAPGMQLVGQGPDGRRMPYTVTKVEAGQATLDGNHPFAGKALKFAIDVREVREATREELSHGHVHGPGGHGHDDHGHDHGHGHAHGHDHDAGSADAGEILAGIQKAVADNTVVIFMKGTPESPMCGFSARAVELLRATGRPFAGVNALSSPAFRQVLAQFSSWPTLPQVFVKGKLIGGTDILMEMQASGELKKVIDQAFVA